jgi:hypothetical protein
LSSPANTGAEETEPGRDAFHRVPIIPEDQGRRGTRPCVLQGEVHWDGGGALRTLRKLQVWNHLGRLLLLLAAFFLAAPGLLHAQLTTLLTNGPTSNRFNIVFLSEGYTTAQLTKFRSDATNALNQLLARAPYAEYSNCFNGFAISVASTNSGSNHSFTGITNNTYFRSCYDPYSVLTIPPNLLDTNYSHGQGRVDALIASNMPRSSLAVLLVNDSTPGGSDGFNKTAIASLNYDPLSMTDILIHETGHVVANLADEYWDNRNGTAGTPVEGPNATQQTNRANIRWVAWISASTPVPTPATAEYISTVGLFEGANYSPTNWYRPKEDCCMQSVGQPFCEVCSEAMVLGFYGKMRPMDSFVPANTNLTLTNSAPVTFSVTLLQPSTHNLNVQWFTNGVALPGATNSSVALSPAAFPNATNRVSAVVSDPTPLVRNDPTGLLRQTNVWNLNVSLPQLTLDSPQWLAGGKFTFHVTGVAPQAFAILAATNLSNWTSLSTNSLVGGQFTYTNSNVGNIPWRFYQAKTPP